MPWQLHLPRVENPSGQQLCSSHAHLVQAIVVAICLRFAAGLMANNVMYVRSNSKVCDSILIYSHATALRLQHCGHNVHAMTGCSYRQITKTCIPVRSCAYRFFITA